MQQQTTFFFKTKHILSELCNILFNASHVSLLFEKHNSIGTNFVNYVQHIFLGGGEILGGASPPAVSWL